MVPQTVGDNALDHWVDHGLSYAARCNELASMVRAARERALEAVTDIPSLPADQKPARDKHLPMFRENAGSWYRPHTNLLGSKPPSICLQSPSVPEDLSPGSSRLNPDFAEEAIARSKHIFQSQPNDLFRFAVNPPKRNELRALRRKYFSQLQGEEHAQAALKLRRKQELEAARSFEEGSRQKLNSFVRAENDENGPKTVGKVPREGHRQRPSFALSDRNDRGSFDGVQPATRNAVAAKHDNVNLVQKSTDSVSQDKTEEENTEAKANGGVGASTVCASGKTVTTPSKTSVESPSSTPLPPLVYKVGIVWSKICAEAEAFRVDAGMKKPRLLLKKRINLAANQIAASVKSVCTKIRDIVGTLNEAHRSNMQSAVSFTMKEIAERLVAEGGSTVALSRTSAFAVGSVIVGVVAHSPDPAFMRNVMLGAFFDKCAFTIPTYVLRHKHETEKSFRSRLNFLVDENTEAYVERMCGYVSLYAAVLQTTEVLGPHGKTSAQNPFPPSDAWAWLARAVNGPQRSVTPDIVHAFLDIAGFEMSRIYGSNFGRLLASVQEVCVRHASKSARPGAKSRISGFVEDFFKAGCTVREAPPGKYLPASDAENVA